MKTLAPISISTYNRIIHLSKTIESLQKNSLAKESVLYLFSDAPKIGDEKIVQIVRDYIHTIDGFKEVIVIEQETNNIQKNMIDARTIPLKKFGKIIRMEDDNIVSSKFLEYMNNGLEFYKDDKRIMAINGFNIPTMYPDSYNHDYYLSTYFNAWGFATWKDRGFIDIVEYNNQYNDMEENRDLYKKVKKIHPKLIHGLKLIQEGKLNAGDYKMTFHLIKNCLFVIRPIKSFVNNIGHDGSGVHCGVSDHFNNQVLNKNKIKFEKDIYYDKELDKLYYNFFHPKISIFKKIKNKLNQKLNK